MKTGHPRFVTAGPMGASMQLEPPFDFDGVTLRVFPLRASLYHLQRFIDDYLNIVPPQVARFRVPVPYAFMSLINYGKMAVDAANMGWIAQREILFCVPLEWYVLEGGKYVFKGWAFVSPFIYVDNELSMATGRNVYGWPKSLAVLDAELNAWMENPRARSRLATASTMVFPRAYEGQRQQQRVFLEVMQSLGPSPLQVPPDLGGAAMPWVSIPNAVRSSASLMRDWVGLFGAMGVTEKQRFVSPAAYLGMGRQILGGANPFGDGLALNTVNLKQFRSADRPDAVVAYQALTNARMEMKTYKNGGLMGDGNMLLGDSSGGFRVLLHRYKATPIIESLGLEVDTEWEGPGASVASLKPVFPYWLDMDMRYNQGETLAWRTKVTDGWKVGAGPDAKRYVDDGAGKPAGPIRNPYNTSTAGAGQEIGGALVYPDTTFRVLPLLADPAKLKALIDGYLNEPFACEGMHFAPWGRYVYLVVANHSGVSSDSNNVGSWVDHDVKIHVAVKWYERAKGAAKDSAPVLRGVALVPIFAYANSTTATITSTEVTGVPVMKAVVECPNGTWLDASGPGESTTDPLLRMTATVLPALGEGQGAQSRTLLEIKQGSIPGLDSDTAWRRTAETWGTTLKKDLAEAWARRTEHPDVFDDALTLPLEVFGKGLPLNILTLKQFRETSEPSAACYQSLVLHRWGVDHVHDVREIETPLYACIYEYPTQPIVQTLGLVAKHVGTDGAARAHYVEPVRPFWFRQSHRMYLGMTIRRRAGSATWETDPDTEALGHVPYFLGDPGVEAGLGGRIYPHRIKAQVEGMLPVGVAPGTCAPSTEGGGAAPAEKISRADAVMAVETMEPQMILGAMLSREWENRGQPRWQQAGEALRRDLAAAVRDVLPGEVAEEELRVLRQRVEHYNNEESGRSGAMLVSRRRQRNGLYASLETEVHTLNRMAQQMQPPKAMAPEAEAVGLDIERAELLRHVIFAATHDNLYRSLRRVLVRAEGETRSEEERKKVAEQFERLGRVAEAIIKGSPMARVVEEDKTVGGRDERLARVRVLLPMIAAQSEAGRLRLRAMVVEDVKQEYTRTLEALVYELSLSAQKPDHCVRRESLADPEREYVFPSEQCWDPGTARWFVGPGKAAVVPEALAEPRPAAAVEAPSTALFDDWEAAKELGPIRHVTVWAGDVVDAVRVGYALRSLKKHGGHGGTKHEVAIGPDETLVGLRCTYGEYFGARHLATVTLTIARASEGKVTTREAGPFGSGAHVTVEREVIEVGGPRREGEEIAALSGGSYLHADGTEALTALAATFGRRGSTRGPSGPVNPPEPPRESPSPRLEAARRGKPPSPRRG